MTKTRITLCILCAATALLAACNKDSRNEIENNTQKSYLTVQFGVSSPLTKTDNSGSLIEGTEAESSVSKAVVYLVQSGQVKAILPVNTLNRISHSGYDNGYETSVLETNVAVGTYDVYVYAGTSSDPFGYSIGGQWKGETTRTFAAKTVDGVENASNTAANDFGFKMFSQNDASVTGSDIPQVTLTSANNTSANPAVAGNVYLDRITAKVTADEDAALTINSNVKQGSFSAATAKIDGILPVSAAQTVYIQQQWADAGKTKLSTPATERYGFINNLFTTTGSAYADIQYSGGEYSSVAVSDLGGKIIPVSSAMYVLENAAEATPVWGSTTGVVFKVTLDATGSGTPSTFFGYNKNSEHFLSLADLQAGYPDAFDTFGNKLADGVTDDDAANLAAAESLLASDVAAFRARTKVYVFEDGAMYYTFFIKDNNYNNYGVFRNTWYQLLVTEITNFGDDIPGGWNPDNPTVNPEPETPVEDEKLYIKVKILVNKWVSNVTTIHLGE